MALGVMVMGPGSIYVDLLEAALGQRERVEGPPSIGGASQELVRTRRQMQGNGRSAPGADRVTLTLARQVAYDIALIRCARCLGIDGDPDRFTRPLDERLRLEHALRSRGMSLE
jgi:hypothetical protein